MNTNIFDMTAVDKRPFPINYHVPSTKMPEVGVHTTKVNMMHFGEFLTELDAIEAHAHSTYIELPLCDVAKRTCFALVGTIKSSTGMVVDLRPRRRPFTGIDIASSLSERLRKCYILN